jgi:hypothetical protein
MAVFYKNSTTINEVSTAILAKALDNNQAAGEGIIEMIDAAALERSVNPAVGGNIDLSV